MNPARPKVLFRTDAFALIAHASANAGAMANFSNPESLDPADTVREALRLVTGDRFRHRAPKAAQAMAGVLEASRDGSALFYDPEGLEELGSLLLQSKAAFGLVEDDDVTDARDAAALAFALKAMHEAY